MAGNETDDTEIRNVGLQKCSSCPIGKQKLATWTYLHSSCWEFPVSTFGDAFIPASPLCFILSPTNDWLNKWKMFLLPSCLCGCIFVLSDSSFHWPGVGPCSLWIWLRILQFAHIHFYVASFFSRFIKLHLLLFSLSHTWARVFNFWNEENCVNIASSANAIAIILA